MYCLNAFKNLFDYDSASFKNDVCVTCEKLDQKLKSNFLDNNANLVSSIELVTQKYRYLNVSFPYVL